MGLVLGRRRGRGRDDVLEAVLDGQIGPLDGGKGQPRGVAGEGGQQGDLGLLVPLGGEALVGDGRDVGLGGLLGVDEERHGRAEHVVVREKRDEGVLDGVSRAGDGSQGGNDK